MSAANDGTGAKSTCGGSSLDGERKSVETIASRVGNGNVQALQQFVNQSPWDGDELIAALWRDMLHRFRLKSAIYVLDDTTLPKKGETPSAYSAEPNDFFAMSDVQLAEGNAILAL